jgi:hypothetical protein
MEEKRQELFDFKARTLKIVDDIEKISIDYTLEEKKEVYDWLFEEYRNFMLVSRDTYINTLYKLIELNPKLIKLGEYLIENIQEYGATKTYFFASAILSGVGMDWEEDRV